MKVRILKTQPTGILVKDVKTGKIIKYPKHFFTQRYTLGLIEVENPKAIPIAI